MDPLDDFLTHEHSDERIPLEYELSPEERRAILAEMDEMGEKALAALSPEERERRASRLWVEMALRAK